ncbi:MAG: glycosyl transferase family 2 [Mucilaginibacter sp.]|nr:glycosyl transferase family 2 [Mucilaginibacter sp.]
MMIYIIIPVFNRRNYSEACLKSLLSQTIDNYKIIVVDHGSTDGTAEMIKQRFEQVILVLGDDSLWWTGATNLGVKEALKRSNSTEDFILTLNNDLIVESDYLEQLLKIDKDNKPCLVGSISVYHSDPEKIQFAGIIWDRTFAKYKSNPLIKQKYSDLKNETDFIESDLLTGRGTLIPIDAFTKYGLYDEKKFPHYAADEDFSFVCRQHGFKLLIATKAKVLSHVTETGLNFKYKKIGLFKFLKTLSSIRSPNNLTIRYRWAKKNAQIPYLYFFMDVSRIFGSYCRNMLLKR